MNKQATRNAITKITTTSDLYVLPEFKHAVAIRSLAKLAKLTNHISLCVDAMRKFDTVYAESAGNALVGNPYI